MTPPSPGAAGDGLLSGITVLDATHLAAGPWCGMMLGDLGADVIKLEPPGKGEIARQMGAVFTGGESAIVLGLNRSKRGLALDLRRPEGRAVLQRLLPRVDVFIENFRPGTVDRLGLDYESASALNPRLVYCSISAFGQDGPYRHRPANDPIIQAITGVMSVTGHPGDPVRVGAPLPDYGAALMAAFAICAALLRRERTGRGERLDTSLLDVTLFSLGPRASEHLVSGEEVGAFGSAHPTFAPYQAFTCADGAGIYVAIITEKYWQHLCRALGRPELADDARFATNPDRVAHRAELTALFEGLFRSRPRAEWMAVLEAADVPFGPVNSVGEALSDPQVLHNQALVSFEHPTAGAVRSLAVPLLVAGERPQAQRPPPLLGQHSEDILGELGFTAAEIADLRARGVIGSTTVEETRRRVPEAAVDA
jgi:crotonobetainyl-CoA:carnitine CoA-transferase CaiB-like acyl-CoA transferase